MTHTPAPWHVNKYGDCVAHEDAVVAEKPHGISHEWESNARLIAAAPDLLDALETIANAPFPLSATAKDGFKIWQKLAHIARAAIEKAKP